MRQAFRYIVLITGLWCAGLAHAASLNDGINAYQSGHYAKGLDILMSHQHQNHPAAQNLIGNAFSTGNGVLKSNEIAARWWAKAAAQNYAPAQVSLSYLYYTGDGVEQSYPEFFDLAGRAAAQNNPQAQSYMGQAFYYGRGAPRNFEQARIYFQRAFAGGNAGGLGLLADMYRSGQGGPQSLNEAAYLYRQDYTRNKNSGALSALEQLAANGSLYARLALSDLSTKEQSERHADRLILAEAGLLTAQCRVGIDFSMGLGAHVDHAAAMTWLEKAKARGSLCAAAHMATLFERGIGVPKDLNRAVALHKETIIMAKQTPFGDVQDSTAHIETSRQALERIAKTETGPTSFATETLSDGIQD